MAERKLSQLQADIHQPVPAGQIGVLMQQPPRSGGNNPPDSNFAAYPRQVPPQGNNTIVAANNFDKGEAKLNYSSKDRTGTDGRLFSLYCKECNDWN